VPGLPLADLVHIQWGGAVGNAERWATGAWYTTVFTADPSPAQATAAATAFLGYFNTFWTTLKVRNASGVTFDSVKLLVYRNNILVQSGQTSQSGVVGTGGSPCPGYTARVVTLQTAAAGRAHRGRMYLPWTGQGITASSLQWSSDAAGLTAFKALHTSVKADSALGNSGTLDLAVVSRTGASLLVVNQFKMDTIPDTQHGRVKKMTATAVDILAFP